MIALEALDNLVTQDQRGLVIALLDDLPDGQRLERPATAGAQPRLPLEARLGDLVVRPLQGVHSLTAGYALHAIGTRAPLAFREVLAAAATVPEALV